MPTTLARKASFSTPKAAALHPDEALKRLAALAAAQTAATRAVAEKRAADRKEQQRNTDAEIAFVEQRESRIAKMLRTKFTKSIQRDARKIARTAETVLAGLLKTTGPARREESLTQAFEKTFTGSTCTNARKIAQAIVQTTTPKAPKGAKAVKTTRVSSSSSGAPSGRLESQTPAQYEATRREWARQNGHCTNCIKRELPPDYEPETCPYCLDLKDKARKRRASGTVFVRKSRGNKTIAEVAADRMEEARKKGKCITCKTNPQRERDVVVTCQECADAHAVWQEENGNTKPPTTARKGAKHRSLNKSRR